MKCLFSLPLIMNKILLISAFVALQVLSNCGSSDDNPVNEISLLSASLNGGTFSSGAQNVPIDAEISLVFSSVIDPSSFESQLSLIGTGSFSVNYANGSTKAVIETELEYETGYTLKVGTGAIGKNGEKLTSELNYLFTTAEDGVIRSMQPCTGTSACLRSVELMGSQGLGTFEFYCNYPIYEENAEWENLTQAIFVVHGASHNADDYYGYLTNTLEAEGLSESTVLISPFFRNTSTGSSEDYYWSSVNYRDGDQSSNANKISSFEVMDLLIDQLADESKFPFMERIIITGQSSGGRFTHVYGPANKSEATHTDLTFNYIVSESQYFYYPDNQRINESDNQLSTPSGCAGYEVWPFGYSAIPPYLQGVSKADFNDRFVNRSIHYQLGNGSGADPTLNTTDCEATLLGSSRYQRGENMYRYMELVYPGTHNHNKIVVPGVSHNGSQIYQSTEFKILLAQLLQ